MKLSIRGSMILRPQLQQTLSKYLKSKRKTVSDEND